MLKSLNKKREDERRVTLMEDKETHQYSLIIGLINDAFPANFSLYVCLYVVGYYFLVSDLV
jgi:hypothetical protein